jgi:hypothetical protein
VVKFGLGLAVLPEWLAQLAVTCMTTELHAIR